VTTSHRAPTEAELLAVKWQGWNEAFFAIREANGGGLPRFIREVELESSPSALNLHAVVSAKSPDLASGTATLDGGPGTVFGVGELPGTVTAYNLGVLANATREDNTITLNGGTKVTRMEGGDTMVTAANGTEGAWFDHAETAAAVYLALVSKPAPDEMALPERARLNDDGSVFCEDDWCGYTLKLIECDDPASNTVHVQARARSLSLSRAPLEAGLFLLDRSAKPAPDDTTLSERPDLVR
jgi:hypothetical protein